MLVTQSLSRRALLTVRQPGMTMTKTSKLSYDEAVAALNFLQTNAALLLKVRKERQKNVHLNLPQTIKYLERSGMSLTDLDSLQVIHVSGTKGKGSTCAFCESILRQSGLKTGFFSSPHLVSVTERIRMNGQPIEPDLFTHHFWMVYDAVCRGRAEDDRPPYFKFLTILALNIFWKEAVDVAVLEVGIGGGYDCTNIVRQPVVTGITALGLDHTSLLGGDIEDIAWHKAGIMKPGVACYVDPQQSYPATLEVIKSRGVERGALYTALPAPLESHGWEGGPPRLGLAGEVQSHNAALALALAQHFLSVRAGEQPPQPELQPGTPLPRLPGLSHNLPGLSSLAAGLAATVWPGRSQLVTRPGLQLYLDGAHTEESVAACWLSWPGCSWTGWCSAPTCPATRTRQTSRTSPPTNRCRWPGARITGRPGRRWTRVCPAPSSHASTPRWSGQQQAGSLLLTSAETLVPPPARPRPPSPPPRSYRSWLQAASTLWVRCWAVSGT